MSTDVDEIIFGLAKRFRAERERLGLTQKELADLLLTSSRTIISYENGGSPPKLDKLILFAGQGADVGYILAGNSAGPFSSNNSASEQRPAQYSPARRVAEDIFTMALTEEDADLLQAMARRLSSTPG